MGKLKDKYNSWKNNRHAKFRDQSDASVMQTKTDSKEIASCYNNDKKLSTFAWEFKQPSHKNKIVIMKKINFISLFIFACLLAALSICFGCSKLINLVDPASVKPEEWQSLNDLAWGSIFTSFFIPAIIFICYIIPYSILKFQANKKFKDNENYKYVYSENLIFSIILLVVFLFAFITFSPFNFTPVILLSFLGINGAAGKFLVILTFILDCSLFLSYLTYLVSTILCFYYNPIFKMNKLLEK